MMATVVDQWLAQPTGNPRAPGSPEVKISRGAVPNTYPSCKMSWIDIVNPECTSCYNSIITACITLHSFVSDASIELII